MNNTNITSPNPNSSIGRREGSWAHLELFELGLAVLVFVAIYLIRQNRLRRGSGGAPTEWPVVGMLPSLALAVRSGEVYEWMTNVLRSSGGTFRFRGPQLSNLNCVVTSDPLNLEHLLKSKFTNFPKGPYFQDTVRDLLGDGIFGADGDTWRHQRKTASLEFHSAKFRALTLDSLTELVHERLLPVLDQTLEKSSSNGCIFFDLQEILLRLTFDNVCMIAFGADPGCLRKGLPQIPFAKAFEDATEATVLRFVTPTWAWKAMRYFNVGPERGLRESIKAVDEFAKGVIRTRKRELTEKGSSSSDLLTVFMRLKDENGKAFSEKFLRDICVNFILAGRDTSSVALCWFFWLIDKNPQFSSNP